VTPDMREILRGMSIASDTQNEFMTADDYYLQPQLDQDDHRRPSNPLRRVSPIIFTSVKAVMFFFTRKRIPKRYRKR